MQMFPNATGYKVRGNAVRAVAKLITKYAESNESYRNVRWLIAAQTDGSFLPVLVRDEAGYAMDLWHASKCRFAIVG